MVTDGNKRFGKGGDTEAEGAALTALETVGQGCPSFSSAAEKG